MSSIVKVEGTPSIVIVTGTPGSISWKGRNTAMVPAGPEPTGPPPAKLLSQVPFHSLKNWRGLAARIASKTSAALMPVG